MNEIKSDAGISPVLSTDGLDGKRWLDPDVLKQSIMTQEQQETTSRGICPNCRGKLRRVSEPDDMKFCWCEKCGDVWVLTTNAGSNGPSDSEGPR